MCLVDGFLLVLGAFNSYVQALGRNAKTEDIKNFFDNFVGSMEGLNKLWQDQKIFEHPYFKFTNSDYFESDGKTNYSKRLDRLKDNIKSLQRDLASLDSFWNDKIFGHKELSSVKYKDRNYFGGQEENVEKKLKNLVEAIKEIENSRDKFVLTNNINSDLYLQLSKLVRKIFDSVGFSVKIEWDREEVGGQIKGKLVTNLEEKFNEYKTKNEEILNERNDLKDKVSELEKKVNELEGDDHKNKIKADLLDSIVVDPKDENGSPVVLNTEQEKIEYLKNIIVKVADLLTQVASLNSDIVSKNTRLNDLTNELSNANTQMNTLTNEKNNAITQRNQIQNELNNANTRVNDLNGQINNLTQQKNNLESDLNAKNSAITDLNNRINTLTSEKDDAVAQKNNLEIEKNQIQNDLSAVNNKYNDLKAQYDSLIAGGSIDENIKDLNQKLTAANNEKIDLENKLNAKIIEVEGQKNKLESDINTKNEEIKNLTDEKNNFDKLLSDKETELKNLKDEKEQLEIKQKNFENDLKIANEKINSLNETNEKLASGNKDEQVSGLLEQIKSLQGQLETKNNEINELNNKISCAKSSSGDDNKKIEELQAEVLKLKNENDELNKKLAEAENKNKNEKTNDCVSEKTFDKIAPSERKNKILLSWGGVKTLTGSASFIFLIICQPIPGVGLVIAFVGAGLWTMSGAKDLALSVFSLLANNKNKKEMVKTDEKDKEKKDSR